MSRKQAIRREPFNRSEWIYDWKRSTGSRFSSWSAIVLVSGLFALSSMALRVSLTEPVEWAAPQASVIQLGTGEAGRRLAIQAAAEGPFPSRFQPSDWLGGGAMEEWVDRATHVVLAPNVVRLRPFPQGTTEPPVLAKRGEPMMPQWSLASFPQVPVHGFSMVPEISCVAGIGATELPKALPQWAGQVSERLAARSWNFMVQLERSGHVRDCVAMAGGDDLELLEVQRWLRGVVFQLGRGDGGPQWVAVAVEFKNQRVDDGTDSE